MSGAAGDGNPRSAAVNSAFPETANPFGAPVKWYGAVSSTMDTARELAAEGAAHGTVAGADFQEKGRGRTAGRLWRMDAGKNLSFTIILRCPGGVRTIPQALTLRAGLAVARAVEAFAPALSGRVRVKWPNDVLLLEADSGSGKSAAKKCAGILAESDGGCVYLGIGVNVNQESFPPGLAGRATSILLASGGKQGGYAAEKLLALILAALHAELEGPGGGDWRGPLREKLYRLGERVRFLPGAAETGAELYGILDGIGEDGALLIIPAGKTLAESHITGELDVYEC